MASIARTLKRVKIALPDLIDESMVTQACEEAGYEWRDRTLPPLRTLQAFATQIAHNNASMSKLVVMFDGEFTEAAYCSARQRLPLAVFRTVFERLSKKQLADVESLMPRWRGLRARIIDGTGCDMPEVPCLVNYFRQPSMQTPGCGFPVTNVLPMCCLDSGLILDIVVSRFATNDLSKTPVLLPQIEENDLLIGDRAFCAYVLFSLLLKQKAHLLVRAHPCRTIPYPASTERGDQFEYNRHRHKVPLLVTLISKCDQVVQLEKPHNCPNWMGSEDFATVPSKMNVRVLKYKVKQKGFRDTEIELMTTLLDPRKYPAEELAKLYFKRWQIEVNFRHIKQTMGMTTLHSKTVKGIQKEILMFACVYNAICVVMMKAASQQGVCVRRISFTTALEWFRRACSRETVPRLKTNQAPDTRRIRVQPRVIKRNKDFDKMTCTRKEWRKTYLQRAD
jgi:hypothetical protein